MNTYIIRFRNHNSIYYCPSFYKILVNLKKCVILVTTPKRISIRLLLSNLNRIVVRLCALKYFVICFWHSEFWLLGHAFTKLFIELRSPMGAHLIWHSAIAVSTFYLQIGLRSPLNINLYGIIASISTMLTVISTRSYAWVTLVIYVCWGDFFMVCILVRFFWFFFNILISAFYQ